MKTDFFRKMAFMLGILFLLNACASAPITPASPGKRSAAHGAGACEATDNIPRVSVGELKRQMDEGADMVVVDTLYPYWYRKGHIKGAINFPWAETLREPTVLPRTKLLVLYCDCACEETSADVAEQLARDWGYKNIKVLKGGWVEWVKLGYPTENGEKTR